MDLPLLKEMVIIFSLAIVVILACHRIKLPTIVGFLLTGVLGGPHALGFVSDVHNVDTLATIGIVLLLFTVGMEFSFKKILEYKRFFLIGGSLQIAFTILGGIFLGLLVGRPFGESLFLGFILSLSSTAIVLRILDERSESDSPHGRLVIGVMIFQDIVAIPMLLLTPLLGEGKGASLDSQFLLTTGLGILVLVAVLVAANKGVPQLLYYIARTRSRELFLLSVLTICFAVAWLTSSVGLSLSLGAFLAGLIVSESEFRNEAIGDILPFRDIFTSFFFISIGMLLDVSFFIAQPITIVLITAGVLVLKTIAAGGATLLLGLPMRTAVLSGIALCQIGEFSFVLAQSGIEYGLADDYRYQLFLAVSLLTMGVTPTLMSFSPSIADLILKIPMPASLKTGLKPSEFQQKLSHKDHIIIIGFGLCGKSLARSAKEAHVPYLIMEMNPDTVRQEKQRGEPIHFGDATHIPVLHHANIENARIAAVVINDYNASLRIVETIRKVNPHIYLIVRTRYVQQMKALYQCGADDVIPDEFGSSMEIYMRVMNLYQIPVEEIEKVGNEIRAEAYEKLKILYKYPADISSFSHGLTDLGIESHRIQENSPLAGKSLIETNLRQTHGITVMGIRRGGETVANMDAHTVIMVHDIVTIAGPHINLKKVSSLFATAKN